MLAAGINHAHERARHTTNKTMLATKTRPQKTKKAKRLALKPAGLQAGLLQPPTSNPRIIMKPRAGRATATSVKQKKDAQPKLPGRMLLEIRHGREA